MKLFIEMTTHYFWYILRHKWFVFAECWRYGIIWRGIWHDWHKFLPSEWIPYSQWFNHPNGIRYKPLGDCREYNMFPIELLHHLELSKRFNRAWLGHQKLAKHHWQYWVLRQDDGSEFPLEIPIPYVLELLADWKGAGRAIVGKNSDTRKWYLENAKDTIILHPDTRELIERELGVLDD